MEYEVIARKWRPQQFDDVVGQAHVITTLKNAIEANRVAHAYLFVGPRGVGKTTLARILARDLNCVDGPTVKACGVCDSCKEIAAGMNLDVQEIDAASHRGIDNVRELRENSRFVPRGRFKIYIIDEVHMLTNEAFNALLKTLEEPPPHLKFFMATTEPQKIPATILSRCQRFDLRRIPVNLIVERLKLIAETEKIDLAPDAALALARAAEGGLRDAESALDQMVSFQGHNIREADVLAVFGLVSSRGLESLADELLAGDVMGAIRIVAELDEHGKDMQRLLIELIEHFRNLLIYTEAGAEARQSGLIEVESEALERQAAITDTTKLLRIIEILMDALDRLRPALSKRTLVETALIRCARIADLVSLDQLLERVEDLKRRVGSPRLAPIAAAPASTDPAPITSPPAKAELNLSPPPPPAAPAESESDMDLARLRRDWHLVMERVGRTAIRARNYLLDAEPLAVEGDRIVIGIEREFADRMEQLQQPRNRKAAQKAVEMVLHRPVSLEFRLCDKVSPPGAVKVSASGVAERADPAPENQPSSAKPADDGGTPGNSAMRKWMDDKKVQNVLDVFNGSITEIRE